MSECKIGDEPLTNSDAIFGLFCKMEVARMKRPCPWLGTEYKEPTEEDRLRYAKEEEIRQQILIERESKVRPIHREVAKLLYECVGGWGDSEWNEDEAARILAEKFPQ